MNFSTRLAVLALLALPMAASAEVDPQAERPEPVGSAYNGASIVGSSGYILTPDGTTVPNDAFNFAVRRVDNLDFNGNVGDNFNTNVFIFNYGLTDRLEIGATLLHHRTGRHDVSVLGNVKWVALPERRKAVGLVIGLMDAGVQLERGITPYGYFFKNLGQFYGVKANNSGALNVGFGFGTGLYDNFFINSNLTLVRGVDFLFEHGNFNKFVFGRNKMTNYGLRFRLGNNLRFDYFAPRGGAGSYGLSWTGRFK